MSYKYVNIIELKWMFLIFSQAEKNSRFGKLVTND